MKYNLLILLLFILFCFQLKAQNKIVINDRAEVISENMEDMITDNLSRSDLVYTTMVDMKNPCDYYYCSLSKDGNDILLKIEDCDEKLLGSKRLGKNFTAGNEMEKSIILSFSISEIVDRPGVLITEQELEKEVRSELPKTPDITEPAENEHASRYFFSPSAYNVKEGELYYNTLYFFLHDIQYGISDNFSLGMGTTLIGIPFYITPKITFPAGERSTFAIGDMMILGTWGSKFFGNLVYGIYTHGTKDNNISIGAGFLTTNENDFTTGNGSFVLNLSGIARASEYTYIVTENYGFRLNTIQEAVYERYYEETGDYTYFTETFEQKQTIIYGLTGLRFISKRNDVVSWQFGLTYVLNFSEEIPSRYTGNYWYTYSQEGGSRLIAFPTISYTRIFGKKY